MGLDGGTLDPSHLFLLFFRRSNGFSCHAYTKSPLDIEFPCTCIRAVSSPSSQLRLSTGSKLFSSHRILCFNITITVRRRALSISRSTIIPVRRATSQWSQRSSPRNKLLENHAPVRFPYTQVGFPNDLPRSLWSVPSIMQKRLVHWFVLSFCSIWKT